MEIFQLQERLILLVRGRLNYSSRSVTQHNSPFVLILIVLIHLLLIALVLNIKSKQRKDISFEAIMQLRELPTKNIYSVSETEIPNINVDVKPIHLVVPEITFKENNKTPLDLSVITSDQTYELPDANAELYKDVFDPKLRKKLQEAHAARKPKKQESLETWRASNGTTLVDMGSGECMASMPQMDLRDRGTNWGLLRVKCGETESERMMNNIDADLEARKHPLKTQ